MGASKKLLTLIVFSILLLVPVGAQQTFGASATEAALILALVTTAFNPVSGAECTTSDPGTGIIVSGFVETSTGMYSATITTTLGHDPDITIVCTAPGLAGQKTITLSTKTEISAELILSPLVGGTLIPIDATAVLIAGLSTNFSILTGLVVLGSVTFLALYYSAKKRNPKNS